MSSERTSTRPDGVLSAQKRTHSKPNAVNNIFGSPVKRGPFADGIREKQIKLLASNKTKDVNTTYVISACKNLESSLKTSRPESKFVLQRREMSSKGSSHMEKGPEANNIQDNTDRRLTLQRRLRTGSAENARPDRITEEELQHCHPTENLNSTPGLLAGPSKFTSSKDIHTEMENNVFDGVRDKISYQKSELSSAEALNTQEKWRSKETHKAQPMVGSIGIKANDKGSSLGKSGQEKKTPVTKKNCLDQQRMPQLGASNLSRSSSLRNTRSPQVTPKRIVGTLPASQMKNSSTAGSLYSGRTEKSAEVCLSYDESQLKDETAVINFNLGDEPLKAENSAVTVAVRVRPFSKREVNEKTVQVVFMNGQETTVQHPDSKQNYSFCYDFSFWSFEKSHPGFVGQGLMYEKLAVPLLEWSLLGYNTCLFAYGQTGSGKSYTMMGFDGEPGIIPRFCSDLFSRIQATMQQKLSFHLEMSYFEVYNEKIHDLLIFKAENGQKKQPLKVREHPVSGPYVEDLSMNVVSSFQDIQSWLELGNKQRATAATGMNDKSSRSHSVFTLVMTQTKTEYVDGQEHDHRRTSRINLVDLAGSERCSTAQTSGERLKEGVSINKSLLTLGKVISALSENSQTRKKTFIPYRESVLTWLLKESLGGNSKTAMIATISPAATNVEETLSTLRYAKQARLIINVAKVNEDINAKIIRELKSEIEKMRASQRSAKNKDSEKYRQCQHEVTSLKLKLSQQEREMCELRRAWRDKLEQAEQRKKVEMQELQKAGITFKMDNRLPNLVNLNEDPQLSEMLLYMIKQGQTTVGKYKAGSSHDIQLSGALIAENHCIITNNENIVCIIPSGDAKTYVNGNQISGSTILHHGDRLILGGHHYFRVNHPMEVNRLNTTTQVSDGPKDFEFAKNELLSAQRSQLAEEIEEARLRAKEEMMKGIQIAKEMAQQELTFQKSVYEEKIKDLEAQLKKESQKKQLQEMNSKRATTRIQELEEVKIHLQQEVQFNKKRLEMETLATKQALEDHTVRHAKILQALEAEKQKIAKEVQMLQQDRNTRAVQPTWNNMKLSVMIQEANSISSKLKKHTVFSRHDVTDKENLPTSPVQIQVKNLKLGIVTYWSLDKFEYKLAAMKDLYENHGSTKDDDVFYDPGDEWEPDLSNSSVSKFSRRKSLMKNRRISGCLYEIRVHPIQSLQSGHTSGLMNKSSSFLSCSNSVTSNPPDSHLPGICKDLIGSALDYLGRSHVDESSMADSMIDSMKRVCIGVRSVSLAFEQQKDDSTDMLFVVNREAQSHSVQLTSAFQQLVVLNKHWPSLLPESQELSKPADNLSLYIKKLGGYLQLLLQGCASDISSMVTEAKDKSSHIAEQILQNIGHLAALTNTELRFLEVELKDEKGLETSFSHSVSEGLRTGLQCIVESVLKAAHDIHTQIQRIFVREQHLTEIKRNIIKLTTFLQKCLADCVKLNFDILLRDSSFSIRRDLTIGLRNLRSTLERLRLVVVSALEGADAEVPTLLSLIHDTAECSSQINRNLLTLSPQVIGLQELGELTQSLTQSFCREQADGPSINREQVVGPGTDRKQGNEHARLLHTWQHNTFSPSAIQWV
ncbi:kinesin-like protein KIF14 [Xenopus laevis]|uniref:Kinesin-like protein KIF14 n=2 Tax=Xenopus laevis TaxID=8355 RepID=A0A1L8GN93_XENLA|nr:kinesin-like protein KIF14 [Xenopus laevis]XP_041446540.1 kinesin-like protein KIF14 [Xenopus laevis]OCT85297.1 hypothetical protein XELAEV_18023462mg [Xenopus laevis]